MASLQSAIAVIEQVAHIIQPISNNLPLALAAAVAVFAVTKLIKFIKADADHTLLSKRKLPTNAFQGKVVWIIGASQGLGEAITKQFAAKGARLILSSRSLPKLETVERHIIELYPTTDIHLLPIDITSSAEALQTAADTAFSTYSSSASDTSSSSSEEGGVDYVVHVAGASQHAAAEDTDVAVAQKLLDLNLTGPLAVTRATLPLMLAQKKGRHVVVASMSSIVPSPGQCVYAAAKSGLRAYFTSVATEMAGRGVGVTVCCPGPFASGLDGKPRMVYGAKGAIEQANTGLSKKRVPAERVAELIVTAAYYKLDECWIAYHPVLLMGYLCQYVPWLGMKVLKKIGPSRAKQLKEGKGGYDVGAMLKKV